MMARQLPTKPSGDTAVTLRRGKGPTKSKVAPTAKRIKGRKLKPSAEATSRRSARSASESGAPPDLGDQQRARTRDSSADAYIRLRVRVEDGEFSIVDSHRIEGPLTQTSVLEGDYAYEVTDGERLLHAGSIPDLGVFRSFSHPNGTLEQRRHHTYELSSYDFNVRVPATSLRRAALSNIAVVLYRVKQRPPARSPMPQLLPAAPLEAQRTRELREVGRVVGLPRSVLRATPTGSGTRTAQRRSPRTRAKGAVKRGR
jgi:hypothetical protein